MSDDEVLSMGIRAGYEIGGRYEVFDLIGRGGFAAVFRARDERIGRDVAVKVLDIERLVAQGNDKDVMLARFQREARLAARIGHASVVQIHDFGIIEEGEQPFIVMEILKGRDLDAELKRCGPMDPKRILPHFVDVLEGLGEAHELGIVHRDLKPSNLFVVEPEGRRECFKLVDFGIAHLGDGADERLTKTGYMVGTPKYMSPEYLEDQRVTAGMDVYQMALILVECLAGRPVIDEANPWKCAMLHVSEEREMPTALMESELGPVIDGALAIDPEERFGDAGTFAEALSKVDFESVPQLSEDAEWGNWAMSQGKIKIPDGEAREIFEEAHATGASDVAAPTATEEADTRLERVPKVEQRDKEPMLTPKLAPAATSNSKGEAPTRRRLIALAVVLLFALGGGVYVLNQGDEPEGSDHLEGTDRREGTVAVEESAQEEAANPEGEQEAEMEEEEEVVRTVIDAGVESALIFVNDQIVGQGQGEWQWEGDEPVVLRIEADGYESYEERLEPGMERVAGMELVEEQEPEPEPRPEPTPTPTPEPRPAPPSEPTSEAEPEPESDEDEEGDDWQIAP